VASWHLFFLNSIVKPKPQRKESPMSFYTQLTTYQVETQKDLTLFPTQDLAERQYQEYVKENIPCEFYSDGIKQKEYKP